MIDETTPAHFLEMMEHFDGRHDVVDAIKPTPFMDTVREVVIDWHSPNSVSCGCSNTVSSLDMDDVIVNRNYAPIY